MTISGGGFILANNVQREIKVEHILKVRETMKPSVSVQEHQRLGRM